MSVVDLVVFAVAAAMVLGGAIGVLSARNPVHSALLLVLTLFGVAVLFVAQQAQFLAAVQVIVYAGAIVVLFLFVIMLLGVYGNGPTESDGPLRRSLAVVVGLGLLVEAGLLAWASSGELATGAKAVAGVATGDDGNVEALAETLFTRYLFAFEFTSVLLIIAVVGAVVLARRPPPLPAHSDLIDEVSS